MKEKKFTHSQKHNQEKACPRSYQGGKDQSRECGGDQVGTGSEREAGCYCQKNQNEGEISNESEKKESEKAISMKSFRQNDREN
jgi:hypothetical protein